MFGLILCLSIILAIAVLTFVFLLFLPFYFLALVTYCSQYSALDTTGFCTQFLSDLRDGALFGMSRLPFTRLYNRCFGPTSYGVVWQQQRLIDRESTDVSDLVEKLGYFEAALQICVPESSEEVVQRLLAHFSNRTGFVFLRATVWQNDHNWQTFAELKALMHSHHYEAD